MIKLQEDVSFQEESSEIYNIRESEINKINKDNKDVFKSDDEKNKDQMNSPSIKLAENIIFINNDNSSYNQFINIKNEELVDNLNSYRKNNSSNYETFRKKNESIEIEEIHVQ